MQQNALKYDEKDEDVLKYCGELLSFIMSNPKKCCPNKWWSLSVVELLLNMHVQYTTNYAAGKQDPSFLESKQQEQKTKFENDKKTMRQC
jgi:hypothetical protein